MAIVARIEIDYMKPALYGQDLGVYTKISKMGTKSFELASIFVVKLASGTENEFIAKAKVTLVSFDPATNSSIPISESERKIMHDFFQG
jgi:acyl-CoA thioesterase FadM